MSSTTEIREHTEMAELTEANLFRSSLRQADALPSLPKAVGGFFQSQESVQIARDSPRTEQSQDDADIDPFSTRALVPKDTYVTSKGEYEARLRAVPFKCHVANANLLHMETMGRRVTRHFIDTLANGTLVEGRLQPDVEMPGEVFFLCLISDSLILRFVELCEAETKVTAMAEFRGQLVYETKTLLGCLNTSCNMKIKSSQVVFHIYAYAAPRLARLTYLAAKYNDKETITESSVPPPMTRNKLVKLLNNFQNLLDNAMRKEDLTPEGWGFSQPIEKLNEAVIGLKKALVTPQTSVQEMEGLNAQDFGTSSRTSHDKAQLQATATLALDFTRKNIVRQSSGTSKISQRDDVTPAQVQTSWTARPPNELKRPPKGPAAKSRQKTQPPSRLVPVQKAKNAKKVIYRKVQKKDYEQSRCFTATELGRLSDALGTHHADFESVRKCCPGMEMYDIKGLAERCALGAISNPLVTWAKPVLRALGHDII
ncbi:MAG: hypothetical protein M1814_000789 [Vezdaea aestivalis]|nr:MAG: hypothetical protein M1814_000789 [Vezdaea aestivalis]